MHGITPPFASNDDYGVHGGYPPEKKSSTESLTQGWRQEERIVIRNISCT